MLVSVITPVLNEEHNLPLRARELSRQQGPWEWIVVDGGSSDRTRQVAEAAGALLISSAPGRGTQLNVGASYARGSILVFVHADTGLPDGALSAVRDTLANTRLVGGNFTLRFSGAGPADRLFTWCNGMRQRIFGTFFGDSVIFIRRKDFDVIGGFPDVPIMEDYELCCRMRRQGRVARLPLEVMSSNRRYCDKPLATAARWTTIYSLYRLGVSAQRLALLYAPSEY